MISNHRPGRWAGRAQFTLALPLLLATPLAQAGTSDLGGGFSVDYLANLTYSLAVRADDPDPELIGAANVNGDDGNRNFNKGSLINNRMAALAETNFKYRNYGVFLRGSAFYDAAYRDTNDNDSPATVNKDGEHNEFTPEAQKLLGQDARLLDAYAYASFNLGSTAMDIRAGSQVVSWGESLFFPNMSGSQSPADATKSNVPGTEVKDILMPLGQVYVQWGLTSRFSVLGYWQYDWNSTELTPAGGYFSTSDILGPGGDRLILNLPSPPSPVPRVDIPRGPDLTPGDDGQWGAALRYLVGDATEVTLYRINYHDKNPAGVQFNNPDFISILTGQTSYQALYLDDITMSAVGLSSELFGAAIGAELSLREDAGISVNAPGLAGSVGATVTRGDVWQGNLNFTKLLLPSSWYDGLTLLGEVSWLRVEDVDAIVVPGQGGGPSTSYDTLSNGREAGAYQVLAQLNYKQVFAGWDMTMSFIHANQFHGKSPIGGALGSLSGEGDIRYAFGPAFKYLNNLELAAAYNGYAGGTDIADHGLEDRSYYSFSVKYSF